MLKSYLREGWMEWDWISERNKNKMLAVEHILFDSSSRNFPEGQQHSGLICRAPFVKNSIGFFSLSGYRPGHLPAILSIQCQVPRAIANSIGS